MNPWCMLFHPAKVPFKVFSILFKSHWARCDRFCNNILSNMRPKKHRYYKHFSVQVLASTLCWGLVRLGHSNFCRNLIFENTWVCSYSLREINRFFLATDSCVCKIVVLPLSLGLARLGLLKARAFGQIARLKFLDFKHFALTWKMGLIQKVCGQKFAFLTPPPLLVDNFN